MAGNCIHGYAPGACLICRTLGTGERATTAVVTSPPDVVHDAVPDRRAARPVHHRSAAGTVVLVLAGLVAAGAAAWILVGLVFTILHVLELTAVGAGCGWVGYKIGHFRGSRHPRSGT